MSFRELIARAGLILALVALAIPVAAQATDDRSSKRAERQRLMFATDTAGNLLVFRAGRPEVIRQTQPITGLPAGVVLRGIDFRPATGDLYGVGSDSVVYRVNPRTAIAIAEGPAFSPALRGSSFGIDFNPTVDKIRVTSDANQNFRLDPDPGNVLGGAPDPDLNPGDPNVVGSAYLNSSFTATRPAATTLFAIDSVADTLAQQNPANAGTLVMPLPLGIDVGAEVGFDIAGVNNVAYLAATTGGSGSTLYTVDLGTGKASRVGRIGNGRYTLTGLAAWQDKA